MSELVLIAAGFIAGLAIWKTCKAVLFLFAMPPKH